MRRARLLAGTLLLAGVAALSGACGGTGMGRLYGAITIYASPSLTDAIRGMSRAFTDTYPGVRIDTLFGPDSALGAQAAAGPVPDLVAAEDPATLVAAGATGAPRHFAQGQLVIAVPAENPASVRALADLTRAGLRVALCAAEEPCGAVAEAVLAAGQVSLGEGALREPDVRSALQHVIDATADAALVYRSDALAAGDEVLLIETPVSGVALAQFVAAVTDAAANPAVARAFLDYLSSAAIQETLVHVGFRPPA